MNLLKLYKSNKIFVLYYKKYINKFFYLSSPIYYYSYDELGTFIIGGSEFTNSFRGFISQMDIYRRIAFTYEQVYIYNLLKFIFNKLNYLF